MNVVVDTSAKEITGTVKNITFHNPENGFFVVKVLFGPKNQEATVVGRCPAISPGEVIQARGSWKPSPHGVQFAAEKIDLTTPKEAAGIEKYLTHSVGGIGPSYAKKLVEALGSSLFDVVRDNPDRLSGIPGIGPKRAQAIVDSILEGEALRKIMVFLYQHGINAGKAKRVYEALGPGAVEKLNANPYQMVSVWGVGFSSADAFAKSLGIAHDSEYRVRAGVLHCLSMAKSSGACGMPEDILVTKTMELLGVSEMAVLSAIETEVLAGALVPFPLNGTTCIFLTGVFELEKKLAQEVIRLRDSRARFTVDNQDALIDQHEARSKFKLERLQKEAVRMALSNNVCVVTGGPGCGKTTLTKVILQVFDSLKKTIRLAAPTGKAAKRASEATGFESSTVHRLLEVEGNGRFKFNPQNKLPVDVLVLDETSMTDVYMGYSVLAAAMSGTRIIFVGDVDQLDSVGYGQVLRDLIESREIACVKLTEVFRQAASSKIIINAHRVNKGECPPLGWNGTDDFGFLTYSQKIDDRALQRKDLLEQTLKTVHSMWERGYDPIRDVQVLAPMKAGELGTRNLNLALQAKLNPHPQARLKHYDQEWRTGDKVIHIRNNYEKMVFNGEIGFITHIDVEARTLLVEFDGRSITYEANDFDELELAYVLTIHKSQGSEFPVVVMVCDVSHFMMLKRKVIYTGITRAKKLMLVIGTKQALAMAVARGPGAAPPTPDKVDFSDQRFSLLAVWLKKLSQNEPQTQSH